MRATHATSIAIRVCADDVNDVMLFLFVLRRFAGTFPPLRGSIC